MTRSRELDSRMTVVEGEINKIQEEIREIRSLGQAADVRMGKIESSMAEMLQAMKQGFASLQGGNGSDESRAPGDGRAKQKDLAVDVSSEQGNQVPLRRTEEVDMGIEKEQSSTSEAEGEEKKIVMLAKLRRWEILECGTQVFHSRRVEFHSVDLKHNILTRSCFPSIIMADELSSDMLSSLNKFIYLVGGASSPDVQSSDESASSNDTFYSGGSCLDMSDEAPVWRPAPVFVENTSPNYVSFFGNIYNFGSVHLAPQVLDCGALGHCKSICSLPIPQSLAGCSVSVPVLPDPSNKRILMRLYGGPLSSPSLYAFTPDPDPDADAIGTWECLTSDFQLWARAAAVVNGVIYFHCHKVPSLLCAFHITKKIWLKVWWDSCFKDNVDMNVETFNFDAMLHLGHNILCFAGWMRSDPMPAVVTIEVMFYKFQVLVTGETVTVKVCDSYSYELPRTTSVLHFLPFSRVDAAEEEYGNSVGPETPDS